MGVTHCRVMKMCAVFHADRDPRCRVCVHDEEQASKKKSMPLWKTLGEGDATVTSIRECDARR
jgi:hypothetical protein